MDRDRQRTDPSRHPATSSGSYRGSYAPQPSSAYHQQTSASSSRSRQSPPTTPGDRYAGYPSSRTSPRLTTDVYAGGSRRGEVSVGIGALPQNDPYWVGKRNAPQTNASPYGQDLYGSNKFQAEEEDDYPDQRSEYSTKGLAAARNSDGSSYRKSGNPIQGSEDYDEVYGYGTNKKVTPNPDNYYYSGDYHVGRTNSYLPYSHHTKEPYKPPTGQDIIGDNDPLPNYNSPGDGAHLRDGKPMLDDAHYDIAMDNLDPSNLNADNESIHYRDSDYPPIKSTYSNPSALPTPSLPTTTKKRACRCCCGVRRRTCVFLTFGIFVVIILVAYFCWPRIPVATINSASLVSGPIFGSNTAPSINAEWSLNLQIDNRGNFIPIKFSQISAIVNDALTLVQIGSGSMQDVSFSPGSIQTINFPITINYATLQYTDSTWQDLYKACGPQQAGESVALQISFTITFELFLLGWTGYKPSVVATPAGNFGCPGA